MRVRCVHDQPEGEALGRMGRKFYGGHASPLEIGRDYLVYGISFRGGGCWYEVMGDGGTSLVGAPIELFEVLDPRASRSWRLGRRGDAVVLSPELFFVEYFHDRLSDGDPELVRRFQRLTRDLEAEMAEEPWGWRPDEVVSAEVVPLLVAAWPELAEGRRPDAEAESQPYVAMTALVDELVEAVRAGRTDHLDSLFHVAERLLGEGSREVRELLVVGLLEGVQDRSTRASVPLDGWEDWLGPRTRTAWRTLAAAWKGEPGAADLRRRVEGVLDHLEQRPVSPAVS